MLLLAAAPAFAAPDTVLTGGMTFDCGGGALSAGGVLLLSSDHPRATANVVGLLGTSVRADHATHDWLAQYVTAVAVGRFVKRSGG